MEQLQFNIDLYNALVIERKTHIAKSRKGDELLHLITELNFATGETMLAIYKDDTMITRAIHLYENGMAFINGTTSNFDLILEPIASARLGFINCYNWGNSTCWTTLDVAQAMVADSPSYLFTLEIFADGTTVKHDLRHAG